MHECTIKTRESSYVPRQLSLSLFLWSTARRGTWDTWKHRTSPLRKAEPRVMGHVAAPELPSQEGRARSHGTHGSTGAHLVKEVRSRAKGHMAASELTSVRRRCLGPWDTWRHRSSPLQGYVVRSYRLCGRAWMHALLLVLT
jgi:hypothetical protein